jgi:hypothetical protein
MSSTFVDKFPIMETNLENQLSFVAKADIMLSKNDELHAAKQDFITLLLSKFESVRITTKLQTWPSLSAKEFLKELTKQKIKLPLAAEAEWIKYFEEEKIKVTYIQKAIEQTDNEIDQMVYQLYGLSDEEIKICKDE